MRNGLDKKVALSRAMDNRVKQGKYLLGVCALSAGLVGCVAPGMHMNSLQLTPTVNANNAVVKPVVQTITAQLVQAQTLADDNARQDEKRRYHRPSGFHANTVNYHYRIAAQDVLRIVIWNQSVSSTSMVSANPLSGEALNAPQASNDTAQNVSNLYTVDGSGNIFYPYLGSLEVSGKTVADVRTTLTQKLASMLKIHK